MATTNWSSTPSLNQSVAPIPMPTTGLLGQAGTPAASPQPVQAQANLQTMEKSQTVAGGLDAMLAQDSPYMQRAKTGAAQTANARGLLNSSMAASAGESAAIDAAAPIAQADASLYANQRTQNQNALNTTSQFNAQQANQFGLADKSIQAQTERDTAQQQYTQSNMALGQQLDLGKMDKQAAITLSQMSAQQQNELAKMAASQGYNLETMTAQQVNDLKKMYESQQYTQANMGLSQQFDLSKMDKQASITLGQMTAQQQNDLAKMAKSQGYNLETMNAQQVMELQKMAEAQQFDLSKMSAAAGFTADQMAQASVLDLQKLAASNGYDLSKMAAQQGYDLNKMSTQQVMDLAKMDKTYTQADKEAQAKFGYDTALMEIQRSSNIEVAGIEAQYKNLTQASISAASMSNVVNQNINAVLLNEKLDAAAKTAAVAQIKSNYVNSLQLIGAMAGDLNLSNLMDSVLGTNTPDFTPTPVPTPVPLATGEPAVAIAPPR